MHTGACTFYACVECVCMQYMCECGYATVCVFVCVWGILIFGTLCFRQLGHTYKHAATFKQVSFFINALLGLETS